MEKSKFCQDVSHLPALRLVLYSQGIKAVRSHFINVFFSYPDIVNYLLYTTSFVTLEDTEGSEELQKSPKFQIFHECVGS